MINRIFANVTKMISAIPPQTTSGLLNMLSDAHTLIA